jgi:hypothetical protein
MKMSVRQSPSIGRPISSCSSLLKSQLLHDAPHHHSGDALSSSALDFLLEMHLRREREQQHQTDQTDNSTTAAAQKMTTKERTMIQEGCRKERTAILEEAFKLLEEDY